MSSDFAALARDRWVLQTFCDQHVDSVQTFRAYPSFKLHIDEQYRSELRHLTSTATCIESLLDAPNNAQKEALSLARKFAIRALRRPGDQWRSEDSAAIYCRCRALPLVVQSLSENGFIKYSKTILEHLETILRQLEEPERFAIGEADPKTQERQNWYPPNAYHTFWFLSILERIDEKLQRTTQNSLLLGRRAQEMLLWARSLAGKQIALHAANSPTLDSDQLAWSLTILVRFGPDFQSSLTDQDFFCEGFKALFLKQTDAGTWPHGQRLFHYKYSGNAYCYVYETFAALLKSVLHRRSEGKFLRTALQPFRENLIKLWEYALNTQKPLSVETHSPTPEKLTGWSSGHRVEDRRAESWATASVFSYTQTLRRLLGIWTRENAIAALTRGTSIRKKENAFSDIAQRGDTWSIHSSAPAVSEDLMTLFVNPVLMSAVDDELEPDAQPIHDEQARSAILFGPPGTSKTTLARSVAAAIGWRYVELHASHFVAQGLPEVQRTADALFQQLMELDHSVVLFDEIDELVRERDMEPDAFGRFLTTSMLPKLAELWEQRKVIYFIATNHIEYFDRAVTRARRFDALIFVTPPSFNSKVNRLKAILLEWHPAINVTLEFKEADVVEALRAIEFTDDGRNDVLAGSQLLAKFILLRWDQLEELALRILSFFEVGIGTTIVLSSELITAALGQISDPSLQSKKTYLDFAHSIRYSMRDHGKVKVWEVQGLPLEHYPPLLFVGNGKLWLRSFEPPENIRGIPFKFLLEQNGVVRGSVMR